MEKYQRFDSCYGKIIDRCNTGVFVELDNGEIAFARSFHNLKAGSKVLCSVERMGSGYRKPVVTIDSVIKYVTYFSKIDEKGA